MKNLKGKSSSDWFPFFSYVFLATKQYWEREREYFVICSNQRDLKWREPEIEVGFIYIHRLIKRVRWLMSIIGIGKMDGWDRTTPTIYQCRGLWVFVSTGTKKKTPPVLLLMIFLKNSLITSGHFFFFLESTFGQFENINNCR